MAVPALLVVAVLAFWMNIASSPSGKRASTSTPSADQKKPPDRITPEARSLAEALQSQSAKVSQKTRLMVEKARQNPNAYVPALSALAADAGRPLSERQGAVKALGILPCVQAVDALRQDYPRFLGAMNRAPAGVRQGGANCAPTAGEGEGKALRMEAVKSLTMLQGFGAQNALLSLAELEPDAEVRRQIVDSICLLAEEKDLPKVKSVLGRLPGLSATDVGERIARIGDRRSTQETLVEVQNADLAKPAARERMMYLLKNSPVGIVKTASIQKMGRSDEMESLKMLTEWVIQEPETEQSKNLIHLALSALAGKHSPAGISVVEGVFALRKDSPFCVQRERLFRRLRGAIGR